MHAFKDSIFTKEREEERGRKGEKRERECETEEMRSRAFCLNRVFSGQAQRDDLRDAHKRRLQRIIPESIVLFTTLRPHTL